MYWLKVTKQNQFCFQNKGKEWLRTAHIGLNLIECEYKNKMQTKIHKTYKVSHYKLFEMDISNEM